jgi:hypothetical protein
MSDLDTQLLFDASGNMAVKSVQDVEPILEHNKVLRSQTQRSDWGRHIAEIPNVIMTRWLNEEWARGNVSVRLFGPEMDAIVARKLKDPEWAYLRTDSAQVQGFLGFGS